MADRVQAYDQPPLPWANSHSEGSAGSHPPDRDRRQPHRAATSPERSSIKQWQEAPTAYPTSLFPGQRPPQTVHRSDIYFSQAMNHTPYNPPYGPYPTRPATNPASNTAAQFYPPHQYQYYGVQQAPLPPSPAPPAKPPALRQEMRREAQHEPLHPALYRSFTSPPPVPPKPSLLFESEPAAVPTSAYLGGYSSPPAASSAAFAPQLSPPVPSPSPVVPPSTIETRNDEGGDDLAVALALSKDESLREEERLRELARQEDEELQRALAASMSMSRGSYTESQPEAGPSSWASAIPSSPILTADLLTEAETPASCSSPSPPITENSIEETTASPSQQSKASSEEREQLTPESEMKFTPEAAGTTSPPVAENSSTDADTFAPEQEVPPSYSPPSSTPDRTPTPTTSPPINNLPEPDNSNSVSDDDDDDDSEDDDDGEGLPYLRGESRHIPADTDSSTDPTTTRLLESSNHSGLSPITASLSVLSYDDSYIDEDEALARRLAEEEEAAYRESQRNSGNSNEGELSRNTSVASTTAATAENDLPTYTDAVSVANSDSVSLISARIPEVKVDVAPPTPTENGNLYRNSSINSGTSAASEPAPPIASSSKVPFPADVPQVVTTLYPGEPQRVIGRTSSMSALPNVGQSSDDDLLPPPTEDSPITSAANLSLPSSAPLTKKATEQASGSGSLGVLNATHFVDAELLYGVSINFSPPVISAKLAPMQTPMPTLISLPYGRCPPLHFQATSWRHMLKLMARLSSTKIEPSIEALAVNKNEVLKLRTVVQFLKPHHMAQEWRTILYFTIDHPVPNNIPNAHRYHVTNVNILPFSYTLSSVPAVLRDASDTVLSRTYTIPATPAVPYPSLPITFPNLAMYLQAALDDSRQQSDSGPLRKLAKMVQTCYSNDFGPISTDEPEKSSGVSGLFKKVIGRGGKKGKKGAGGGNEETYDLVTPFVPDEWGS